MSQPVFRIFAASIFSDHHQATAQPHQDRRNHSQDQAEQDHLLPDRVHGGVAEPVAQVSRQAGTADYLSRGGHGVQVHLKRQKSVHKNVALFDFCDLSHPVTVLFSTWNLQAGFACA